MLRVGLTGGLGSGKSTVAKIFETLGIPVYYADDAAKRVMNEDGLLKKKIIEHFGEESYLNEALNRPYLAATVFPDPKKIALLNSLVHPATIADAAQWMKLQTSPYAIKEAALIFESEAYRHLDYVIGVFAPYALRLQRGMQRDHLTKAAIDERMKNQMDETKKMQLCNFVINNDETELLIPQVIKLHQTLAERSLIEL
ncbi:MAG: dephospho-CoA kinase [Ferruginibacter sp.]